MTPDSPATPSPGDREQLPCGYCQQVRDMIALAKNRDETELAHVLTDVLVLHRSEKHAGPRLVRCA
ncbi:hypothetical protein ITI46_16050 [Streptomyces oryzae]|uniref:Uncharacterized protein n=1 Tax=Streptomyces oryzae TaxID=1434886 RepID=A0ABS3XCQ9_9ACTN|nr:hypothetical protein [Streptomyces oryzae]MBO8193168.1 hypothetical protein [Streptomyces oryzae]